MSKEAAPESPTEEVTRLRSCLNDLVGMTALPAVSTDGEPTQILSTLFDALLKTLRLAFVFVRLNDPDAGSSIEITRVAESFGGASPAELSLASARVGLSGPIGLVVAGSERRDFPATIGQSCSGCRRQPRSHAPAAGPAPERAEAIRCQSARTCCPTHE